MAGCSAHVSVGGPSTVPPGALLRDGVACPALARQENQPSRKWVCPADLTGKVGTRHVLLTHGTRVLPPPTP